MSASNTSRNVIKFLLPAILLVTGLTHTGRYFNWHLSHVVLAINGLTVTFGSSSWCTLPITTLGFSFKLQLFSFLSPLCSTNTCFYVSKLTDFSLGSRNCVYFSHVNTFERAKTFICMLEKMTCAQCLWEFDKKKKIKKTSQDTVHITY